MSGASLHPIPVRAAPRDPPAAVCPCMSRICRWADPTYRERARGFHRDERTYSWQHIESGRIVSRTKAEMREEHGLRPDSLNGLLAGRIQTSWGWRMAPQSLLGESPR